jgi:hypothetical protein
VPYQSLWSAPYALPVYVKISVRMASVVSVVVVLVEVIVVVNAPVPINLVSVRVGGFEVNAQL